jgi:hypothetical protein
MYNAPEVRAQEDSGSGASISTELLKSCDVWSFGLLVWETFLDGARFLPRSRQYEQYETRFKEGKDTLLIALLQLNGISDSSRKAKIELALRASLVLDPNDRCTMATILAIAARVDIDQPQ